MPSISNTTPLCLGGPFFRGHAVEALEQAIPPLRHVLPVSRYGSGSEKIKCKSVWKFLCELPNRQTNNGENITSLTEVKMSLCKYSIPMHVYNHILTFTKLATYSASVVKTSFWGLNPVIPLLGTPVLRTGFTNCCPAVLGTAFWCFKIHTYIHTY